jgi:hypothetical protein
MNLSTTMDATTIITLLSPFALTLFDTLVKVIAAAGRESALNAKAAKQEARKLLYAVYRELQANLACFDPLKEGAFQSVAVNSPANREFAAQLNVHAMSSLLEYAVTEPKLKKGKAAAMFASLEKAVRYTENLTRSTDHFLALQRKTRIAVRLKHIKDQHLAVYRALFRCHPPQATAPKPKTMTPELRAMNPKAGRRNAAP